jgi:thiopeptide-type bacteriocin biosynthesis protein
VYRSLTDAVLIRAAVCTPDQVDTWPDLSVGTPASWAQWLTHTMAIPGFAAAVHHASPDLTRRITAVQTGGVTPRDARRVVLAVMRYLLRATGRATPYGLFAGIAAATVAEQPHAFFGTDHRPTARIRAGWLEQVIDRLEADPNIRRQLLVRRNDMLMERDGEVILHHRAGTDTGAAPVHVRVRATGPVTAALAATESPIRCGTLADRIATEQSAPPHAVDRLLAQLVAQRLLVTELRPPTNCTDPLSALLETLDRMHDAAESGEACRSGDVAELVDTLRRLAKQKQEHDHATSAEAAAHRRALAVTAATVADRPAIGVDLLLDCDVTLPPVVMDEACRAASALTRLAVPPRVGWASWHRRFLERFGPYALVPVLDAVDPVLGLGYPAGYAGAAPAPQTMVTDRDRALLAVAQRAALARQREIVLDDATITAWASPGQPSSVQVTTELTVRVHANDLVGLHDGRFNLSLVRVSRNAGTSTGRLLDLLDAPEQHRFATAYATGTPPITDDAMIAQLVAPTRYAISMDVARAPQVLPHLISLGEFYTDTDPQRITIDDLAVTADPHRLYLISLSHRRPVQPVPVTAVEPDRQMMPITRFLAEASTALAVLCHPFDWGPAARDLPFLPALRYGRTLLSAACWRLTTDDLPPDEPDWIERLDRWRDTVGCPPHVSLGSGDQCLTLDLNEPAHDELLRDYLHRNRTAVLHEAPTRAGWIGGRAHEIVIPLAATTPPAPAPRLPGSVVGVRDHGHLPGGHCTLLKIYADPAAQDRILTTHLRDLLTQLPGPWWFQRYHDPDQHLRLRLTGNNPATLRWWARRLREHGLTSRSHVDTDYPETDRFGGPTAYPAAEAFFAADSAAALAQLTATGHRGGPAGAALTAASMLDLATALLGDLDHARRWLTEHVGTQRPAPPRALYQQAVTLADPDYTALTALPGGHQILAAWQTRATVVLCYRDALHTAGLTPATLLPDLLHLHHTRIAGPDRPAEAVCLHLARAAVLSWAARVRSTP